MLDHLSCKLMEHLGVVLPSCCSLFVRPALHSLIGTTFKHYLPFVPVAWLFIYLFIFDFIMIGPNMCVYHVAQFDV